MPGYDEVQMPGDDEKEYLSLQSEEAIDLLRSRSDDFGSEYISDRLDLIQKKLENEKRLSISCKQVCMDAKQVIDDDKKFKLELLRLKELIVPFNIEKFM